VITTAPPKRIGRTTTARWPMAAVSKPNLKKSGVFWTPRPLAGSNFCADRLPFPKIWECAALQQRRQRLGASQAHPNDLFCPDIQRFRTKGRWGLKTLGTGRSPTALGAMFTKFARDQGIPSEFSNSYKKSEVRNFTAAITKVPGAQWEVTK
jgi:hypothetical protein